MFKLFHGAPYAVCVELKNWRGCCRGGDMWKFV